MSDSDQSVEISCLRADIDNLKIEVDLLRRGEKSADFHVIRLEETLLNYKKEIAYQEGIVANLNRHVTNLLQDSSNALRNADDAWEYVDQLKEVIRRDKEQSDLYQEDIEEYVNKYVLKTDYYKHYINLRAKESTNND